MKKQTLHEELAVVDETLAELEERRANIVNRIVASNSLGEAPSKILQFPYQITVTRSARGPAGDRRKVSKAKPSKKRQADS